MRSPEPAVFGYDIAFRANPLVRATCAELTLGSFCMALSIGSTVVGGCCSPYLLKKHVKVMAINLALIVC